MQHEIRIPDVGEAADVEVIEVCVQLGDQVAVNDVLVVLESDKASMEVSAEHAGAVVKIATALGDRVATGTLIMTLEVAQVVADEKEVNNSTTADQQPNNQQQSSKKSATESIASPSVAQTSVLNTATVKNDSQPAQIRSIADSEVYAGPGVRRLARELGVDLAQVKPTGDKQRILKEDVQEHVKQCLQSPGTSVATMPTIDYSQFGAIDIQPMMRATIKSGANLHQSWLNLPHVTQHDEADITELEDFRKTQNNHAASECSKLTLLPFILKACASILLTQQKINSSLSADGRFYVFKQYVHIGVAIDTPDGLLVPVIRDVNQKGIRAINEELQDLSTRSRQRQLKPNEMQGASFTVSSLGRLGGTGFTPIVNAPQVAILGVAKATRKPVYQGDELVPRVLLPLSLSYDHKAVNGAEGGRFMLALMARLNDLRLLLL